MPAARDGDIAMSAEAHAVCVAINDRDRAWYEMLVPFILSLRQSDYRGRLVVIGFGLSESKAKILRSRSIEVVDATEADLPTGRFVEVAKLCAREPELKKVALYDADIWFCSETFDLFEEVEGDNLMACKDAFFCDFISDPLIGPARADNIRLVLHRVMDLHGAALQAGLVAGTSAAWLEFGDHIRACVARIGQDFRLTYGTDTCFLHLWAAQGRTALLSETQNFVAKKGPRETADASGRHRFMAEHDPIRGLHMTSDVRFLNPWRYFTNYPERALREGRPFALREATDIAFPSPPPHIAEMTRALGLDIVSMSGERGATFHAFRDDDGVTLIAAGNHDIVLRSMRPVDPLVFNVMTLSGFPGPIRAQVRMGGQTVTIQKDLSQWVSTAIAPGAEIHIRAEALPGQMGKIVWILSEGRALAQ